MDEVYRDVYGQEHGTCEDALSFSILQLLIDGLSRSVSNRWIYMLLGFPTTALTEADIQQSVLKPHLPRSGAPPSCLHAILDLLQGKEAEETSGVSVSRLPLIETHPRLAALCYKVWVAFLKTPLCHLFFLSPSLFVLFFPPDCVPAVQECGQQRANASLLAPAYQLFPQRKRRQLSIATVLAQFFIVNCLPLFFLFRVPTLSATSAIGPSFCSQYPSRVRSSDFAQPGVAAANGSFGSVRGQPQQ